MPIEAESRTEEGRAIDVSHLTKIYHTTKKEIKAIDDVSIHVDPHEFVSIVGPSGCGKSTLLKILAGLDELTEGKATIFGKVIEGPGADRGMVFQGYTLFPWLTVRKNIEFGLRLKKMSAKQKKETSDYFLKMVDLERFANAYPKELSGGMKQRVAIARALANNPKVLLMDEPFGALDAQTRSDMQQLLLEIWKREKTTIVFITHDIEEAIFLSQRIYVMHSHPGRLAEEMNADLGLFEGSELVRPNEFLQMKDHIVSLLKK
ncbi:ABC transporter ATP-binding protein [Sporolactobacillus shoreae]|uniref:Carnitine transport ATP-binding protein OpuCA n=1 Tax=Sporolactobacillus shoreae TaxID=1465501 RepID=A0A4Z0GML6_9BACL|nr:ABC transporter ATP-binding protein [Sporolactobacillus shoreae]TGA98305.1 ABC transporter ATP-binding protein [Sporolactobacillus shoreae]